MNSALRNSGIILTGIVAGLLGLVLAMFVVNLSQASAANTSHQFADFNAGPSNGNPYGYTKFGGALYFTANDGVHGSELWRLSGGKTEMIDDINPGKWGSEIAYLKVFENHLYFRAHDGSHGEELWRTDGETTELMFDLGAGADSSNISSPDRGRRQAGLHRRQRSFRLGAVELRRQQPDPDRGHSSRGGRVTALRVRAAG